MSNFRRFLIEFSYNGARFSGVAKQTNNPNTVHNVIHDNLKNTLVNSYDVKSDIRISSRTDAGVHALLNTAHFDLLKLDDLDDQDLCKNIKNSLNTIFIDKKILIRVLNCREVDPRFVSRHAKSRTYLYRLGYLNNGPMYSKELETIRKIDRCLERDSFNFSLPYLFPLSGFLSILDADCVTELREPFNRDLFFKALELFNVEKDFSAFTTKQARDEMVAKNKNPIKKVELIYRTNNTQFLSDYLHSYHEKYEIIELEIKSTSFLYRMIRKMVGAASDVARGLIPIEQINHMLNNPEKYYFTNLTSVMKPNGLFLKNVEYDEEKLKFEKSK
ncbi:unnamed protein product [Brachionus calyciflorus]|uniref:tRNA pseudouridine synthase n=1 Tax=Brachionus calyciflorus TaxID=104777 RepID=A0A813UV19_9BILA|nr:unnamed protein product [Brachionus calyciflorus]